MKKNLKSCLSPIYYSEPRIVVDMNDYEMIQNSDLTPDLKHKKTAHMSAAWSFDAATRVRMTLGNPDLSAYRYLTFSVFAADGMGGSFHIRFESDTENGGDSGYCATLPIIRNGWNDYRLELPFLQARLEPRGWDHIRAIVMDCVIGGQPNKTTTVLSFDSFYGWEEEAPKQYVRMPELKGAAVFSKNAAYAIVDRKRVPVSPDFDPNARPYESGGILWLPMAPVAAIRTHRAVVDTKANTLSFSYRRKKYVFFGNSDRYTVNGEEEKLPFLTAVRAGTIFFPADYLCAFFHWRQLFTDPAGPVVLSNRKNVFDGERDAVILRELNAEMTFVQPTGEELLADLHRKISNPDKGRLLLLPEEWMALRKSAKVDGDLKSLLEKCKDVYGKNSEEYRSEPLFSNAEAVLDETAAQKAFDRLTSFAALFRMTGEKHYAERTALECEALANLTDWKANDSIAVAAEIGFGMALAYDWCHTAWSEGRKALLERSMLRYAMRPAVDCYNGKGKMWSNGTSTAAKLNCAFTALALALADIYPETSLRILRHSLRCVIPCFDAYSPDGGYSEGPRGWEKATNALVLLIAMLQSACGKDYGFASALGFAATARFPLYMETENGAWNLHNTTEAPINTCSYGWFTKQYGNTAYAWVRHRDLLFDLKPLCAFDLAFYTPIDREILPELPLDAVYRRAGVAVLRSGWSGEDTYLALHGGSNHEIGGELDAGTFLLEMGGERFFRETGGNEALPVMLRRRAEGQNTMVINPTEAPLPDQNPDAIVPILEARSTTAHAYAVMDMTTTNDLIVKGKRGFLLTNARSLAVIQDELTLSEPATAVWSAYTDAEVTCHGKRTALLKKNGKTLLCKLYGGASAAFEAIPVDGGLTRIRATAEVKEKLRLAVACKLMEENDNRSDKIYDLVSMRAWEI